MLCLASVMKVKAASCFTLLMNQQLLPKEPMLSSHTYTITYPAKLHPNIWFFMLTTVCKYIYTSLHIYSYTIYYSQHTNYTRISHHSSWYACTCTVSSSSNRYRLSTCVPSACIHHVYQLSPLLSVLSHIVSHLSINANKR